MSKNTKYTVHSFKGVLGDFATEWWTDSDRRDWESYIQRLKETGEYGKPQVIDIELEHDPLYDSNKIKTKSASESYRMVFLDMSKYE